MRTHLSVIIPVYNEESVIVDTLRKVLAFLKKKDYQWEVIIVDDGSHDQTTTVINDFLSPHVKLKKLKQNLGKGAAIREGVSLAQGDYILFSDADLSVSIEYVDKFLLKLEGGSDIVLGSRRIQGSKIVKHQGWLRENMGRVFTVLSQIVTNTKVTDFTCGFKGFKKEAAKKIFSKSLINRWVFDSEIVFLAHKFKYEVTEIPVEWVNREDSRITSLGSTGYKSFLELLQIRLNNMYGKYK
jgi:dolichyl-phosphate beta-glucosyltransferase